MDSSNVFLLFVHDKSYLLITKEKEKEMGGRMRKQFLWNNNWALLALDTGKLVWAETANSATL